MSKSKELEPVKFSVTGPQAAALLAYASADDARVNLSCVVIAADASRLFATDGHTLCMMVLADKGAADPRERCDAPMLTIPRATWEAACKGLARGEIEISIEREQIMLRTSKGASFTVDRGSCVTPPPVHAVFPSADCYGSPAFVANALYLSRLAKVGAAVGSKTQACATTASVDTEGNPLGPIVTLFDDPEHACSWYVLTMPMRDGAGLSGAMLTAAKDAAAARANASASAPADDRGIARALRAACEERDTAREQGKQWAEERDTANARAERITRERDAAAQECERLKDRIETLLRETAARRATGAAARSGDAVKLGAWCRELAERGDASGEMLAALNAAAAMLAPAPKLAVAS